MPVQEFLAEESASFVWKCIVRNLLKKLKDFGSLLAVRVDGMIHPEAAADIFLAPLHRSFLISCFVSGTAALFILPLHLAFAGAPHAATLLVMTWMLSQWPIAHFLSRTGALNKAIGLSSGLFACFVSAICVMSGGESSFALLWLVIPIVESAFATERKVTLAISGFCLALFAGVCLLAGQVASVVNLPLEARIVASSAALFYAGMLVVRISMDRGLARHLVSAAEVRRHSICSNLSETLCSVSPDGRISVLGGPVKEMVGVKPSESERDWLFHRLHVADRPLYLTNLADVRLQGDVQTFDVRLRTGSGRPGDLGKAEYAVFSLTLRPANSADGEEESRERTLLLSLRPAAKDIGEASLPAVEDRTRRGTDTRWTMIEEAGTAARDQLAEIVDLASMVEDQEETLSNGSLHRSVQRIRTAGKSSADSLNAILDLVPEAPLATSAACGPVNVRACLDHSSNLIRPLADRQAVGLDVSAADDLPDAFAEKKAFRQSLHLILSELVETVGAGGQVFVEAAVAGEEIAVHFDPVNRSSSLHWHAEGSRSVLDQAGALLVKTGATLKIQSALGRGESVLVLVPASQNGARGEAGSMPVCDPGRLAVPA